MFKVVLTTERHGCEETNPVFGSEFECEGIVRHYYSLRTNDQEKCPSLKEFMSLIHSKSIGGLSILWDNGKINSYSIDDVTISSTDEQVIGMCATIW